MASSEALKRARELDEDWLEATAKWLVLAIVGKITPGDLAAAKYTLREKLQPLLDAWAQEARLEEAKWWRNYFPAEAKQYDVRLAALEQRTGEQKTVDKP